KTLADILPADMYKRLKGHLDYVKLMIPSWMQDEHRGLYSEYLFKAITGNWEKKRPVWVMLMINSLTESDIRSTGIPVLDLWLAREATRLGKRAGAVERVEEQCLPLNGLNGTQVRSIEFCSCRTYQNYSFANYSLYFSHLGAPRVRR
ncbi:Metalloprotease TIKI1, partial [Araneus ventricosus]